MKFPIRLGKFKSTRILAGASGLLLALTLVVAFVSPVSAVPQQPHKFWGTVSIDSVPAPEGTEVVARIANVTQNFTTAVDANHTYGYDPIFHVKGDDPETPEKEGGNNGDTIEFYVAGTWATNFTFSPGSYNELNLSVEVIANATLEGHVSFAERGSAPGGTWIEPFNVMLFEAGNLSHMLWTGNATTNSTGVFNITGLTPGTYDIGIKNWTCLSEVNTSVTLTVGNTTAADFGTTREGDSDNDDWITGADRNLLYTGWGTQQGDAGWNAHCDFNRDGWLTGADRNLMYTYWAQHGDLV